MKRKSLTLLLVAAVSSSLMFWSGDNPAADVGSVKKVDGKDGVYTVETKADGYHIEKEGEAQGVDLVFNESDQTWSVEANGQSEKLMTFEGDDEVVMYLPPDGQTMNVTLDEAGVMAFRQVAEGFSYYAAR